MKTKKTNLFLFVTLYFTIILFFFITSYHFLINDFKKLEEKQNHSNIHTILSIINTNIENIKNITNDYSKWDDTYNFIETSNPEYIYENFREGTNTLDDLDIDFIIYSTLTDKVIFSKYAKSSPINNTQDFETTVVKKLEGKNVHTVFQYNSELLYLIKSETKKSDSRGKNNGYILSGKFINQQHLNSMTKVFENLEIINLQSSNNIQIVNFPFLKSTKIDTSYNNNEILNNIQIFDYLGNYVFSISAKNQREIVNNGQDTIFTFNVIVAIFLFFIFYILYRNQSTLEGMVKEKSKEIIKQQAVIAHQTKMAAMGEMLENIAHQWRQPLSVISSTATGLAFRNKSNLMDNDQFNNAMATIHKTTKYLSNTIDDFKDYFQSDHKKVTFNLNNALEQSLLLIDSLLESNNIKIIKKSEDIDVYGIENEMIQVFLNIINNSIDAFENQKDMVDKIIIIEFTKEKESNKITFKDNAGGIPQELINRIFEPYYTTKHKSQGTGIGLYMSYEIITKRMNGELFAINNSLIFNNTTYAGAEFIIKIPKAK